MLAGDAKHRGTEVALDAGGLAQLFAVDPVVIRSPLVGEWLTYLRRGSDVIPTAEFEGVRHMTQDTEDAGAKAVDAGSLAGVEHPRFRTVIRRCFPGCEDKVAAAARRWAAGAPPEH